MRGWLIPVLINWITKPLVHKFSLLHNYLKVQESLCYIFNLPRPACKGLSYLESSKKIFKWSNDRHNLTVCFMNTGTTYHDETQYLANSLCDWIWLNIPPCRGAGESWVLTSWHVITRHDTWCGARADQGTCHHSKGSNMCNVRGLAVMSNLYISNPQPQSEPRLCSLCGQCEAAGFYWFPQL